MIILAGVLFSRKFTIGVVTVGASAVNCDCFHSVDLLVTFVHFFIPSFIRKPRNESSVLELWQHSSNKSKKERTYPYIFTQCLQGHNGTPW